MAVNQVEWYSEPSSCIIVGQIAVIPGEGSRPTANEPDLSWHVWIASQSIPPSPAGSQLLTERKTRHILSATFGLTPSNCQANESLVHGVAPRELNSGVVN